jgi:hypothetical protein
MFLGDRPVRDERLVRVLVLAWSTHEQPDVLPDPVLLAVRDPVGRDELAELLENVRRERLVAAQFLGGGHEAEDSLRVTGGECRHGCSRIRRFTYGNDARAGVSLFSSQLTGRER